MKISYFSHSPFLQYQNKICKQKITSFKCDYTSDNIIGVCKVYDKIEKKNVKADIVRTTDGINIYIKLWVNNKEIGTSTLCRSTKDFFEGGVSPIDNLDYYKKNDIYEALELVLLKNHCKERYKHIGKELIKEAVKESYRMNLDGHVVLNTMQLDEQNPVPFYYKMGFRSNDYMNQIIEKKIKRGETQFSNYTPMYLPDDKRVEYIFQYCMNRNTKQSSANLYYDFYC